MLTDAALAVRTQEVRDALIAARITPFSFERIRLSNRDFATVKVGGLGGGTWFAVRHGVTIPHDRTGVAERWRRQPVSEFILLDECKLPDTAMGTLERLRTTRLPIGCSVMVWSLGLGMGGTMSRNRMLVLECAFEFDRGHCFALCRWNG